MSSSNNNQQEQNRRTNADRPANLDWEENIQECIAQVPEVTVRDDTKVAAAKRRFDEVAENEARVAGSRKMLRPEEEELKGSIQTPSFLEKLHHLCDCDGKIPVKWSSCGRFIERTKEVAVETRLEALDMSWRYFQQKLKNLGFDRIKVEGKYKDEYYWYHPCFKKDHPDLVKEFKKDGFSSPSPSSLFFLLTERKKKEN